MFNESLDVVAGSKLDLSRRDLDAGLRLARASLRRRRAQ